MLKRCQALVFHLGAVSEDLPFRLADEYRGGDHMPART